MARDSEGLKIRLWASTGERQTPEAAGLERNNGWPVSYEHIGGGRPERTVFNQILRELSGLCVHLGSHGIPPPWDARVNYVHYAFVDYNGQIYKTTRSTGPNVGDILPPPQSEGWVAY